MARSIVLLALLSLAAVALRPDAAHAQATPNHASNCTDDDVPSALRIPACTRLIETGNLDPDALAFAYMSRGNGYTDEEQLEKAFADYDKALVLNPSFAAIYANRAIALQIDGQLDRAMADYERAIELDPEDAATYYNRGLLFQDRDDPVRARADFDRAIALDPELAASYHARALLHEDSGDLESALADFDQAAALAPAVGVFRGDACWIRAVLGRELDVALAHCDAALDSEPDDENHLYVRGLVHLKARRFGEAIADLSAVLAITPQDARSLFARGVSRLAGGDRGGMRDLEAARALEADIDKIFADIGIRP